MAITSYTGLKTAVANWLNRNDLTSLIPDFIALAEAGFRRDDRLRQVVARDVTAAEGLAVPSDFKALLEMYHDGATYYGPVLSVSADELSIRKAKLGDTGVPRYVAVIDTAAGKEFRFAPEPSGEYTLRMTYESMLDSLSDSNTSNWLLDAAPDIYLFGALIHAEGFLQEDNRVPLWKQQYEEAALRFRIDRDRRSYSGRLTPRPAMNLGDI